MCRLTMSSSLQVLTSTNIYQNHVTKTGLSRLRCLVAWQRALSKLWHQWEYWPGGIQCWELREVCTFRDPVNCQPLQWGESVGSGYVLHHCLYCCYCQWNRHRVLLTNSVPAWLQSYKTARPWPLYWSRTSNSQLVWRKFLASEVQSHICLTIISAIEHLLPSSSMLLFWKYVNSLPLVLL